MVALVENEAVGAVEDTFLLHFYGNHDDHVLLQNDSDELLPGRQLAHRHLPHLLLLLFHLQATKDAGFLLLFLLLLLLLLLYFEI